MVPPSSYVPRLNLERNGMTETKPFQTTLRSQKPILAIQLTFRDCDDPVLPLEEPLNLVLLPLTPRPARKKRRQPQVDDHVEGGLGDHPYMTLAEYFGFWTPPPCLHLELNPPNIPYMGQILSGCHI